MKPKTVKSKQKARSRAATGSALWVRVQDGLPMESQRVIAIYRGVYHHRIVTFWRDGGGNPHFGHPSESDGNGSQPATHWHPLPEMPNDLLTDDDEQPAPTKQTP